MLDGGGGGGGEQARRGRLGGRRELGGGEGEAAAGESRVFLAAGEQSRARPIDVRQGCTPADVIFLYALLTVFY